MRILVNNTIKKIKSDLLHKFVGNTKYHPDTGEKKSNK